MQKFWQDLRYAWRQLRRSPGFAITAVLALALGIGPNVAIFSIIWATFLAAPPYPNAKELVVVWRHYKGDRIPTGGEEYAELAAQGQSFQSLSFQSWLPVHLTNADHTADQEAGLPTSPGLATRTVREPLLMGRDFLPDEGVPGRDHVVILSNWLWRNRYYSDPNILGHAGTISREAQVRITRILFRQTVRSPERTQESRAFQLTKDWVENRVGLCRVCCGFNCVAK